MIDWTAIILSIFSALLGIGSVGLFLRKYMPMVTKYSMLAKDAIETIADISAALMPDSTGKVELTPEEIAKIQADAIRFQAALKA